MAGEVSRNDSIQNAYLNKLTGEYPYTGYKPKEEKIEIKFGDTNSKYEAKYSSKVTQKNSTAPNGCLDYDNPGYVTPGSLPKRRARDFFNELEDKGFAKTEFIKDPNANWLVNILGGIDMKVISVKMPPNEDGKYPNLKYFMELTNLSEDAFVNLPKEALEHPEKYVLKGTVHIDAEKVYNLYN